MSAERRSCAGRTGVSSVAVRHLGTGLGAHGGLPASDSSSPRSSSITLLGTYVRPFGDRVWSGGLVSSARRARLLRRARRGWR